MTSEHALAPHVEPAWRDAFVLELRLHQVPGAAIGAALVEVEGHCVDSGQDAPSAFGDPVTYARSLAETLPGRRRMSVRDGAAILAQTAGVMGVVWSLPPWVHGEHLVTSRGSAAVVALVLLLALALCGAPTEVLGRVLRAVWWRAALVGAATAALLAALVMLVPDGPLVVPAAPSATVSATLMLAGAVALHRGGATTDLVRAPVGSGAAPRRRTRLAAIGLSAALPVAALLVAGMLSLLWR